MRAYCGQTRDPDLVSRLTTLHIGECTVRGELASRKRDPWFYDNGAYRDWTAAKGFDVTRWMRDQRWMAQRGVSPDFSVVPDKVAQCEESLAWSAMWFDECVEAPRYLAVQNGMTEARVRDFFAFCESEYGHQYAGLFVGGSLDWKLATSQGWVTFAHGSKRKCHIGRVGPPDRVKWAHEIGADSIDSSLPLIHKSHLARWLEAIAACGGSS